jgi:hypothetical protein
MQTLFFCKFLATLPLSGVKNDNQFKQGNSHLVSVHCSTMCASEANKQVVMHRNIISCLLAPFGLGQPTPYQVCIVMNRPHQKSIIV